ncbi:FAD-binding oxidoreductase [Chloroflexota bacterium]
MTVKSDLVSIVGSEYFSDELEVLERYSKDYSFVTPGRPSWVVFPKDTGEIQGVVKYANEHSISVVPRSSRVSFYGAGIPSQGGIIIDLTRMNRILEVDMPDKKVKIEPGVNWAQVQEKLGNDGIMVCSPLLPHPLKSVLTSSLEREPILIPKPEYNDTLLTVEVVLPTGELFWTGTAMGKGMKSQAFPESLIPGSTRLFQGAQGNLGIITWANIKAEFIPKKNKLFFIPLKRIEDIAEPIYRIQRRVIGSECLVLNSFNLAAILATKWPDEFRKLREGLPPWVLILNLSGFHRHPEGRIEYEEEALKEVASEVGFEVLPTLAGIPELGVKMIRMLRKPWSGDGYWKFRYKGSCNDIFFYTTLDRITEFNEAMNETAVKYGYPTSDIAFYLQPMERGRACFCQYGFHYEPDDAGDISRVRSLYLDASERAISMGGFFTTPYGPWADMVYSRAPSYSTLMKVVKNAFDPKNIMNPGKLCFK